MFFCRLQLNIKLFGNLNNIIQCMLIECCKSNNSLEIEYWRELIWVMVLLLNGMLQHMSKFTEPSAWKHIGMVCGFVGFRIGMLDRRCIIQYRPSAKVAQIVRNFQIGTHSSNGFFFSFYLEIFPISSNFVLKIKIINIVFLGKENNQFLRLFSMCFICYDVCILL